MNAPQSGIFALGTASHAYLEFDVRDKGAAPELLTAVAGLREPRTTMGGVNLVAGFRPELWRAVAPGDAPDAEGFNRDLVGSDGFTMPATQHDAVLWLSGSAYDVVFDVARGAIAELSDVASLAEETSSWPYRHDLDLTGFIDGTENPTLPVPSQEAVIGRRKSDSVELEHKRPDSHVASTDQDRFGKIFRRNMRVGTVSDHGTMFVAFSAAQRPLSAML